MPHRLELSRPPARPPHLAPPLTCASCPRPLLPAPAWFQLPCAHDAPHALRASGALVLMGDRGLLVGRGTPTHHLDLSSKALLPEPPPSPSCLPTVSFLPCAPPDFQLLPLCAPDSAAMGSLPDVCCLPHSPSCLTQSGLPCGRGLVSDSPGCESRPRGPAELLHLSGPCSSRFSRL